MDKKPLLKRGEYLKWPPDCQDPGKCRLPQRRRPGEGKKPLLFAVRALQASSSQPRRPQIERLTASLVPGRVATLAAALGADTFLLAYQTLVAGYMEVGERDSYREGMLELLLRRSHCSALATVRSQQQASLAMVAWLG